MTGETSIARRVVTASLLLVLVGAAALLVRGQVPCDVLAAQPACQVALQPGPIEDTLGLITVTGAEVFPPTDGSLHLTTVAVQDNLGFTGWIGARTSPSVQVVPREQIYPPGFDRTEVAEINAAAMRDSQLVATIVVLESLGYELHPQGALVVAVQADAATDELEVDDVIVAVDGAPVRESTEVVEEVRARSVGDPLDLQVRGPSGTRTVQVVLGRNPDDPEVPYVGVLLTTDLDLPIDIEVDAGAIGGPSAGMVFALSLLELLEPGDLLGGREVAGTGTLARDGSVGGVGGVTQKLVGATSPRGDDAPAEVFLVPRDNLEEALRAPVRAEVVVVPVGTLTEALDALSALRVGQTPTDGVVLAAP